MSTMRVYLIVVGARPNFIKVAPFFKRIKEYPDLRLVLVHTGQHFDENMSKVFFDEMGIPKPDIQLEVKGEFHTEKLGKMFTALKKVTNSERYHGVIVFGDINSTLAGAIAASRARKKLIHVESGLRSHDRRMPEEINRVITDHLSDVLFVTEQSAVDNLILEGIDERKIHLVGNIMIESLELFMDTFNNSTILRDLGLTKKRYVVSTIHRAENTDDVMVLKKILHTLKDISKSYQLVLPLHPGTKKMIYQYNLEEYLDHFLVIEPVGYIEFMKLVLESKGVVTDSGGIQEETTHLGIPCCTLRDNTERPITILEGTNRLFPIETLNAKDVLSHLEKVDFSNHQIPLWDADVSRRILDLL